LLSTCRPEPALAEKAEHYRAFDGKWNTKDHQDAGTVPPYIPHQKIAAVSGAVAKEISS